MADTFGTLEQTTKIIGNCSFNSISGSSCGHSIYFPKEREHVFIKNCNKDTTGHLNSYNILSNPDLTEGHLICYRVGIFTYLGDYSVCPAHRYSLGLRWRRKSTIKCDNPRHSGDGKAEKGRSVGVQMSRHILTTYGMLVPVGSGLCRKCRRELTDEMKLSNCSISKIHDTEKEEKEKNTTYVTTEQTGCEMQLRPRMDTTDIENGSYNSSKQRGCEMQLRPRMDKTDIENGSYNSSQNSSQDLIGSQTSNWSDCETRSKIEILNSALGNISKGNISPVKFQLGSPLDSITSQSRNYLRRKALQIADTIFDIIAPGQARDLLSLLTPETASDPCPLDNSITPILKLYNNASNRTVKEQLLSIMAGMTTKENLSKITGVSKYKIDKLRAVSLDDINEKSSALPRKRQRMDEAKLDHALAFFFSPAFHQLVSYGTREMRLETGEEVIIPDIVRTACHSTIIQMYQSYCEEDGITPLSRSTLFKILKTCAASKRKNLHGLDNITANGLDAFSTLEKTLDNLHERSDIDTSEQCVLKTKLVRGKNYLKNELKLHVFFESSCADHCIQWSLSDPQEACFQSDCNHSHDITCQDCDSLTMLLSDIGKLPLTDDEAVAVTLAQSHISNWKGHILRTINQDQSRIDHFSALQPNQMLIVMDWAMKFLPQLHREKQSDWFGQKGISWHVAVCIYKAEEGLKHQTMVHILKSGKQDWFSAASILEHLLKTVRVQRPDITEVFLRSDNAGCYHCGNMWGILHDMGNRTGVHIKDFHYSEAQSGKSYCDAKIAHLRQKIRVYVADGNDVRFPEDMKRALDSCGGVTGCQTAIVEILYENQNLTTHKFKDVASICNVDLENSELTMYQAYQIGTGKRVSNIAEIVNNTQGDTGLKVIMDFQIPNKISGNIKIGRMTEKDKQYKDLFPCTEDGCLRNFPTFSELQHHVYCEIHTFQRRSMSSYDAVRLKWAESCNSQFDNSRASSVAKMDQSSTSYKCVPKGWALRKDRKIVRFKTHVREFLQSVFKAGEKSGKKANAFEVSLQMRLLKNDQGERLIAAEDCLQPSQILSYFSRLATQKKAGKEHSVAMASAEDDEDLTNVLHALEMKEVKEKL